MVLWLKSLFGKKPSPRLSISFDHAALKKEIEKVSEEIVFYEHSKSFHLFRKLIESARNVQILEINRINPKDSREIGIALNQGRLQAFTDLLAHLDRALMDAEAKKKDRTNQSKAKGEINVANRKSYSRPADVAGPASF